MTRQAAQSEIYAGATETGCAAVSQMFMRFEDVVADSGCALKADLAWVLTTWFAAIMRMGKMDDEAAIDDVSRGIRHCLMEFDQAAARHPSMARH